MKRAKIGVAITLAAALLAPALATAQEGTVSWIYMYKVKRGQGSELVELVKTHYGADIEAQIDAGNVTNWGIASKSNYDGGYTHIEWLTHPSWAALAASEAAWETAWKAKSRAEKDAEERGFTAVLAERTVNRVAAGVVRAAGDSDTPPKYLVMGEFQALPGKASAGTRLYKELAQPVWAKLAADGAIGAYGMAVPAMHDGGWSHWTWYTLVDMSSMAAVQEALGAFANDETDRQIAEIFDMSAHRDTIYSIEHLRAAGGSD